MKELLKLNRHQQQWVLRLPTGHCHLKGHLFNLGLLNIPRSEMWQEKEESATHICDCEAVAYMRFHHRSLLHGTKGLPWHPHKESPALHRKCRTHRGMTKKGKYNRSWRPQCKGQKSSGPPFTYTHTHTHTHTQLTQHPSMGAGPAPELCSGSHQWKSDKVHKASNSKRNIS
jgi:hypothetical protein